MGLVGEGAGVPGEAVEGAALADEGGDGDGLDAVGVVGEEVADFKRGRGSRAS